jgi:hypothetical protein
VKAQGRHAPGGAYVHQKDLGPGTAAAARALTRFDSDPTWSRF